MRNHFRSNIVGYVALFFAMSLGTAYAIDKNSIKSKHIGAGQVKEADLGAAAVTGDKLAANSVDGDNVVDDSLKGADVDEGSLNLPQPTIPSSLPPNGAAGGDLSGEYPNPQVGVNAIGTSEVDGTLTGADIDEASLSGLVAGTGSALTASTSMGASGPGPVILEIPGWGEIEVLGCQPSATPASRGAVLAFDSTGPSGTIWRTGGVAGASSQSAFSSGTTPGLGSSTVANADSNEGIGFYLTRTDSVQTVSGFVAEKTGNTSCDFSAQAVITG